jgi:hypothetical protein
MKNKEKEGQRIMLMNMKEERRGSTNEREWERITRIRIKKEKCQRIMLMKMKEERRESTNVANKECNSL